MSFNVDATFHPEGTTPLCDIMYAAGSDKGGAGKEHNYTTYYYAVLVPRRQEALRVFELGLGTNNVDVLSNMGADGVPGASLRGWARFFPHAQVFGADIDTRILFAEDRIKTYYCDQTNAAAIAALWATETLCEGFDVIVEDGLHSFEANACFLANSLHKLNPGGVYIVEDIATGNLEKLFAFATGVISSRDEAYTVRIVRIPHPANTTNNNVLVIQRTA
jgi:SAM-dependent methyltransferase